MCVATDTSLDDQVLQHSTKGVTAARASLDVRAIPTQSLASSRREREAASQKDGNGHFAMPPLK